MRMKIDQDEDEDDAGGETETEVAISLLYADDAERPTVGSMKIIAELGEEDLESLVGQCQVFYTKVLVQAVRESFME